MKFWFRRSPPTDKALILRDVALLALSILLALLLVESELITHFLTTTKERELIGSFVAGLFFTSIFTTAPAIVTLGEIAQANSVWSTALFGAMGAVIGDLVIFAFIKDQLSAHLIAILKHHGTHRRTRALFRYRIFRWLTFFVGGMIIASPLPDELGISLLGFSKMKTSLFIPISFFFNFLGIVLIGLVAKSLV